MQIQKSRYARLRKYQNMAYKDFMEQLQQVPTQW